MTTATVEPKPNGKPVRNGYALQRIPVERLRPNPWNPNRMEPREYNEYRAEVKHLGRLPKPCVARQAGDAFEIVDGEHGWRAASELGFPTVDCEIIQADDFEAMRQTYKRNQHGTHNPVLQGRMFRTMKEKAGLSNRDLAKQVEVSEGTIRNSILWADAYDLRNGYAPDTVGQDIEDLTIKQLRWYMQLPGPIRDCWLDNGADIDQLNKAGANSPDWDFLGTLQHLVDGGYGVYFASRGVAEALSVAKELSDWRDDAVDVLPQLDEFLRPVLERGLSFDFFNDHCPVLREKDRTAGVIFAITPEEWNSTVNNCCDRAQNDKERDEMIRASIRVLLNAKGVALQDLTDPRAVEVITGIEEAPDYIKNADWMHITEKWWLYCQEPDGVDEEMLLAAKKETVEFMKTRWEYLTGERNDLPEDSRALALGTMYCRTVDVFFNDAIKQKVWDRQIEERNQFAADDERLLTALVERWSKEYVVRNGTVEGRPAVDVLRERLAALPKPEFRLFACELLNLPASGRWLADVGGKQPPNPYE